jgi:hypothetical protein
MRKLAVIVVAVLLIAVLAFGYWYLEIHNKQNTIALKVPSSVSAGQEISVPLTISVDKSINAGQFYFSFPTNLVQVKKIETTGSIFQLWVKDSPSFDNTKGTIFVAGGLPSPGFTGRNGLVATVIFEAKSSGNGTITLQPQSQILLNDGLGTPLPASFSSVNFKVK